MVPEARHHEVAFVRKAWDSLRPKAKRLFVEASQMRNVINDHLWNTRDLTSTRTLYVNGSLDQATEQGGFEWEGV